MLHSCFLTQMNGYNWPNDDHRRDNRTPAMRENHYDPYAPYGRQTPSNEPPWEQHTQIPGGYTDPAEESYPLQQYPTGLTASHPYDHTPSPGRVSPFAYQGDSYFQNPGDIGYQNGVDDMQSPLLEQFPKELHDGPPTPGSPVPTSVYMQPPPFGAQPRRHKSMKRVELYNGNLVLDCPVPKKLLATLPIQEGREFTHMRYTAATGDPSEFAAKGFTLRQALYRPPRQTELFIVITMYNENEILFARTMHSVMKNIAHLVSRTKSRVWGNEGWMKVVVCIVSDGRGKINPRTLSYLAAMGVYQDGIAKNVVNNEPVTAHLYEYTTQISINADLTFKGSDRGIVPVQILFCLKEKNQKKINSHRWFFSAFGEVLNPNVCVLLDAGTQPGGDSIYHLWKSFDLNSNVGGACGEIIAMKGPYGRNLLNPLVAAQNFEYKMSNILDKPLESVFGFISVLPGAFSAYRFAALQNDALGQGPLTQYFKGEKMHGSNAGIFEANMYLAEDRILCFELVAKRKSAWVLHYVKSAYAITDVPDELPELISQRRRWLNGSFFAAVYALWHTFAIWRSDHGLFRKLGFHIEFLYQGISMIFSWFALGNFFIAFSILAKALGTNTWSEGPRDGKDIFGPGEVLYTVCTWIYAALIVMCFVLSMGNRPQGSKWAYIATMLFFAILMVYMIFASAFLSYVSIETLIYQIDSTGTHSFSAVYAAVKADPIFYQLCISLVSTYGLYFLSSFLYFEPWHMFTSFVQYLLISPSYINILNVYAFCNTHDISWGTKGDTGLKTDLGVVSVSKTDGKLELAMPTSEVDVDALYSKALTMLQVKEPEKKNKRDAQTKQEDYYKAFRTRVVLFWILTNGALIGIILGVGGIDQIKTGTSTDSSRASTYLSIIFWSVAGLSAFRFVGCILCKFHSPDKEDETSANAACRSYHSVVSWRVISGKRLIRSRWALMDRCPKRAAYNVNSITYRFDRQSQDKRCCLLCLLLCGVVICCICPLPPSLIVWLRLCCFSRSCLSN